MEKPWARAGRARVLKLLSHGAVDPACSFSAYIAPTIASGKSFLDREPMGSFIIVYEKKQLVRVLIKYRSHYQQARVPLSSWFHASVSSVEWKRSPEEHVAYFGSDAFTSISFYWNTFLPQVALKVAQVCQDPSFLDGGIVVPTENFDGIGVGVVVDNVTYMVKMILDDRVIEIGLPRKRKWFAPKTMRIHFPWSISFGDIKDMIVMPETYMPKLPHASKSKFKYLTQRSGYESGVAEIAVLLSIQTNVALPNYGALEADLNLLKDLDPCDDTDKLLYCRIDTIRALLTLQPYKTKSQQIFMHHNGVKYHILRLIKMHKDHSIGLEKIIQLLLMRLDDEDSDAQYLLDFLEIVAQFTGAPLVIFKNHGVDILVKRYKTLAQAKEVVCHASTKTTASSSTQKPSNIFHQVAQQAAQHFSHNGIAFLYDEYSAFAKPTLDMKTTPNSARSSYSIDMCTLCSKSTVNCILHRCISLLLDLLNQYQLSGLVLDDSNWPRTLELEINELLYWEKYSNNCFYSFLFPKWLQWGRQLQAAPPIEYCVLVLRSQQDDPSPALKLVPELLEPCSKLDISNDSFTFLSQRLTSMASTLRGSKSLELHPLYFKTFKTLLERVGPKCQCDFVMLSMQSEPILELAKDYLQFIIDENHAQYADFFLWLDIVITTLQCSKAPTPEAVHSALCELIAMVMRIPLIYEANATEDAQAAYIGLLKVSHSIYSQKNRYRNESLDRFTCHLSHFLEAFYHGIYDSRTQILWSCLSSLEKIAPKSTQNQQFHQFVLKMLFPIKARQSRNPLSLHSLLGYATNKDEVIVSKLSPMPLQSNGLPLLNLNLTRKPSCEFQRVEQDEFDHLVFHPSLFLNDSEPWMDFLSYLLSSLISWNDHHLVESVRGRFARAYPLGLDVLFYLPKLLNSEVADDVLTEWLCQYQPWNSTRTDHLRAMERLLKLSCQSYSKQTIYFRDFESKAKGAFGTIYKCTADIPYFPVFEASSQSLAIKLLEPQRYANERSVLSAMYNEVLVLERLRGNPAAIQLIDYGLSSDGYFIAMEYSPYNLKEWWQRHRDSFPSTINTLLVIFAEVCEAVRMIHQSHVAHLDIKCENVLVREDYSPGSGAHRLCLGDFGESFYNPNRMNPEFDCWYPRGTEAIKSPEMLQSSEKLSNLSDVWSLGCLLYELITGDFMFYNDDWTLFYGHVVHSKAPIVTPEHVQVLQEKLGSASSALVIVDLLGFMLVRSASERPTLNAVQQVLSSSTSLEKPPSGGLRHLSQSNLSLEMLSHRVRIDYASIRWKKSSCCFMDKLLVLSSSASDDMFLIEITTALHTATRDGIQLAAESPRTDETPYVRQILSFAPTLCQRLWKQHVAHNQAMLSVSPDAVEAAMLVLYMYKVTFFGLSVFEAIKESQRGMNPFCGYTPSPTALAHVLHWEERRARAYACNGSLAYQCLCGQCAIKPFQQACVRCCAPEHPCALCAAVIEMIHKNVYGHEYPWHWMVNVASVDLLGIASGSTHDIAMELPQWTIYRCSLCQYVSHASSKVDNKTYYLASIPVDRKWQLTQRRYYYKHVAV